MRTATETKIGAVVDAYSTGNFLRESFGRLGVRLVHVQSTSELMSTLPAIDLSGYVDNIVHTDEQATLARLRAFEPAFVAVGQEPGVPLADRMSELLGLASNGSALSLARRDKFAMIEAIRAAGLHCASQARAGTAAEATAWAVDCGFPVVVKPLSSGATDGVYICADAAEVEKAATRILATRDIFDLPNTEVLVQSYLTGVEYIVDTVSADGQHYVCGIWRYRKTIVEGGRNIYDRDVLLGPEEAPAAELIEYTEKVLAALGIRWAPATPR